MSTDFVPHPFYLCSADECRDMDRQTINNFGISGYTLMEVAGTRAADEIRKRIAAKSHGVYICGKGNNAGDALVAARQLWNYSFTADIIFVSGTDSLSNDTAKNLELLQKLPSGINIYQSWKESHLPKQFDFVVDGMLGTGLDSDLRSNYLAAVTWINRQEEAVFAIDIPTGLHADSGHTLGGAVRADITLTFGAQKQGFYLNEGKETCGDIVFCDLPFPNHLKSASAFLIDESWVVAPDRNPAKRKHKYDGGVLYIIAGSEGLTGAAILAAKSAWNSGLGAIILVTPKGLLQIYEKQLVQIIKKPVGGNQDVIFEKAHIEEVLSVISDKPGKLLIGPGLGRNEETMAFVKNILNNYEGEAVIDADALFALSKNLDVGKPEQATWILTPHPGELAGLIKKPEDDFDRMKLTRKLSREMNAVVVSKGFPTITGTQNGNLYLTGYDTRIFSRAGFGDVLAGHIAANLFRNNNIISGIASALIQGKTKADQTISDDPTHVLEPTDLI